MGPEKTYQDYLAKGRFMIQRAPSGKHVFYPRVCEPGTGAELEWVEASGRGTVYAVTVNRRRPEQGGDFTLAMVDLEEGPRMLARVVGVEPGEVAIGQPLTAEIADVEGATAIVWRPEASA